MESLTPKFMQASVIHQRLGAKRHSFRHQTYYIHLPLEHLDRLDAHIAIERFARISFYRQDHGYKDGRSLRQWAHDRLAEFNLAPPKNISLLTMPRLFGYVFNPISFWFCYNENNQLYAVLSQVNNTFGKTHTYLCCHDNQHSITATCWLQNQKKLHVSPFYPVEGHYDFRFNIDHNQCKIDIRYHDKEQQAALLTCLSGQFMPLSRKSLRRLFWQSPLLSLKVIALIHYQAFRLFLKSVKYHKNPDVTPPTCSRNTTRESDG